MHYEGDIKKFLCDGIKTRNCIRKVEKYLRKMVLGAPICGKELFCVTNITF